MNADARVAVTFQHHPKTRRLLHKLGPQGPLSLIWLWCWAAANRPSGDLSGLEDAEIEDVAGWTGDPGKFIAGAMAAGFLERREDGTLSFHDWSDHQGYVIHAPDRKAKARLAAEARWKGKNASENARSNARSNAPSPFPSPFPSPTPTQTDLCREVVPEKMHPRGGPVPLPGLTGAKPVSVSSPTNGATATEKRIFEFWRWITERPRSQFTRDRKVKIRSRLSEGYDEATILRAIVGCVETPFNRGVNDRGIEFVDLDLICRNGGKLESYAARAKEAAVEELIERWKREQADV